MPSSEGDLPYETQGILALNLAEDGTSQLSLALELEEDRFTALDAALRKVRRVLERSEAQMVRASFQALSSTFSFHRHVMSHSGEGARATAEAGTDAIAAQIFGWLSSTRLFLDHSRRLLSKTFGRESAEFDRFEAATNWCYDNSTSYRFVDQLRNAFQHAGVPPISINWTLDETTGKTVLSLIARRDQLLGYYDWKRVVREDLSRLDETIDVYDLLVGSVVQYEFLAAQVRDVLRMDALAPACMLRELLSEVPDGEPATLQLGRIRVERRGEDHEQLSITGSPLVMREVETVLSMSATAGPPTETLPCIGSLIDGTDRSLSGCSMNSSNLISSPHAEGVAFLPTCDLHQRQAAKWAVENLGAAGLIHPSLLDYMVAGLAAAGHRGGPARTWGEAHALQRTSAPLPPLGLDLSPSGWKVPQHPDLVHRTHCAIGALTVWSQERGGTPRFFDEVNEMIAQDDGNVEPLLTGLINLSGTLLQMVATLLGRSPESILGGLAEEVVDANVATQQRR